MLEPFTYFLFQPVLHNGITKAVLFVGWCISLRVAHVVVAVDLLSLRDPLPYDAM